MPKETYDDRGQSEEVAGRAQDPLVARRRPDPTDAPEPTPGPISTANSRRASPAAQHAEHTSGSSPAESSDACGTERRIPTTRQTLTTRRLTRERRTSLGWTRRSLLMRVDGGAHRSATGDASGSGSGRSSAGFDRSRGTQGLRPRRDRRDHVPSIDSLRVGCRVRRCSSGRSRRVPGPGDPRSGRLGPRCSASHGRAGSSLPMLEMPVDCDEGRVTGGAWCAPPVTCLARQAGDIGTDVPGSIWNGPSADGATGKSKIAVGMYTVEHELGMSTTPDRRPSIGAAPRIMYAWMSL